MSEAEFREWYSRRSHLPLAVNGHSFVLRGDGVITVDGGKFLYEEAFDLVKSLNSKNPLDQFNATVKVWERNGGLRLIVLGLIAVIVIAVILIARR